jgi:hypothetical protein
MIDGTALVRSMISGKGDRSCFFCISFIFVISIFGVAESGDEWLTFVRAGRAMPCPYKIHTLNQQCPIFLPVRVDDSA